MDEEENWGCKGCAYVVGYADPACSWWREYDPTRKLGALHTLVSMKIDWIGRCGCIWIIGSGRVVTSIPKLVDESGYWGRDMEETPWQYGAHSPTNGYVSADRHWAVSTTPLVDCEIIEWICGYNHWGALGKVGGPYLMLWCMSDMSKLESVLKEYGRILQEGNARGCVFKFLFDLDLDKWLHTKFMCSTKLATIKRLSCQLELNVHQDQQSL